jgi:hypothetical protein
MGSAVIAKVYTIRITAKARTLPMSGYKRTHLATAKQYIITITAATPSCTFEGVA